MTDRPTPVDPPRDPDAQPDWEALARALDAEGDPSAVARWADAHPADAPFLALVKERMAGTEPAAPSAEATERALAAVRARMQAPALSVSSGGASAPARRAPAAPVAPPAWRRWGVPAAAAAVLALASVRLTLPSRPQLMVESPITTAQGVTDTLALPDGSQVILGPGSRLVVADGYGGDHRAVTLEGAGFFTVRHDAARPFVVRVAGAEVRDVGTAFSVKTDRAGGVAVAVTEGVVELHRTAGPAAAAAAPVTLRAGDRGDVSAEGTVTAARGVVDSASVAWTRGVLAYRDAPLREVQADLRRWYGLDVQVSDSLLARRTLTASFTADSATQVLRVVALALGADILERGDTVVLLPQGIVPSRAP